MSNAKLSTEALWKLSAITRGVEASHDVSREIATPSRPEIDIHAEALVRCGRDIVSDTRHFVEVVNPFMVVIDQSCLNTYGVTLEEFGRVIDIHAEGEDRAAA